MRKIGKIKIVTNLTQFQRFFEFITDKIEKPRKFVECSAVAVQLLLYSSSSTKQKRHLPEKV